MLLSSAGWFPGKIVITSFHCDLGVRYAIISLIMYHLEKSECSLVSQNMANRALQLKHVFTKIPKNNLEVQSDLLDLLLFTH